MTTLADRLHCPRCKGRFDVITAASISGTPAGSLFCTACEAIVPAHDGIADFVGDRSLTETHPRAYAGDASTADEDSAVWSDHLRAAAGTLWPASLGDVLELGCGAGRLTRALAVGGMFRGLLAVDSSAASLRVCRARLGEAVALETLPIALARLGLDDDVLRDACFDSVIGADVLTRTGDPRALLTMVHRVLRPGGRALFVVPNRRYARALCHAMAATLVHRHAREGAWSDDSRAAMRMIGLLQERHAHHGNAAALANLRDKNLFDPEALADMALEIGFQDVETLPLESDRLGGETTLRLCRAAGIDDAFAADVAPLVASVGAPYFGMLSRVDESATMLLWLTKGVGPTLRSFTAAPAPAPVAFRNPEAALGGLPPRWSIEATARATPEGIHLSVDGWCLVNADVRWVRLNIDGVIRLAAVGHPRPDVHDVLNRHGLYHPLYALCSGLRANVLFDGVHPQDGQCALRIEVALVSGIVLQGPVSRPLPMDETATLAQ